MPIKPEISIIPNQERHILANRVFTDRKKPRQAFINQINAIKEETALNHFKHHVLVYYGIGGIGKSSLHRNLLNTLNNDYPHSAHVSIDMTNTIFHSPAKMLLELATNFSTKKNISFSHFILAYAIYFKKSNPDLTFQDKKLLSSDNWGLLGDAIGLIESFSFVSVIPDVINKAYDIYKKADLDKEIRPALQELEKLGSSDIEKKLPAFWAYDFKKYQKKSNPNVSVIFVDSYEALWSTEKNDITKFRVDAWIREFIAQLPGVLFVICSREYIDWADVNPEWKDVLDQHILERLAREDSDEFLINCEVKEPDIRNKMIHVSMGHPYQLDLLVDTYFEIKSSGIEPNINLIASEPREILECFLKYLKDDVIATIKLFCMVRVYDIELFSFLLSHISTGYPSTMFREFNKYSFVDSVNEETYHIHEIMRKEMIGYVDEQFFKQINELVSGYYKSKIDTITSYDEKKALYREYLYHKKNSLSSGDYKKLLYTEMLSIFEEYQYRGETIYLTDILSEIHHYLGTDMGSALYNIYVDMVMLDGRFQQAANMIDQHLEVYDIDKIIEDDILLMMYIKKLHHQMIYCDVNDLLQLSVEIEKLIVRENHVAQYNELLFLIATLYLLNGNIKDASFWLEYSSDWATQHNLSDMMCRNLRKQADISLHSSEIFLAQQLCEEGLQIADTNNYIRYKLYLTCTQAEIYRRQKLYSKSIRLYKESQARFELLGIKPWVAHTHLGIAFNYIELGNNDIAKENLNIAENIYRAHHHQWGLLQTSILNIKNGDENELTIQNAIQLAVKLGYATEHNNLMHVQKFSDDNSNIFYL